MNPQKIYLSVIIALLVVLSVFDIIQLSQAPLPDPLPASVLSTAPQETTQPTQTKTSQSEGKSTLIQLLELYVEQERDLEKGLAVVHQTPRTQLNEKILKLYEAKIASRSLDFEQAQKLLEQVDSDELTLLKAAVVIAIGDRDQAGNYLHELSENHPDPQMKLTALALLNIYHTYDKHREADESYLWTLFAQKIGELGEIEISHYLASRATDYNSQYRDAWIIRGYDEYSMHRYEDAETSLLQAYQLDPGNPHIQYLLGLTYFELGNADLSNQYLSYAKQNLEPQQNDDGTITEHEYLPLILEKLAENAITLGDYALADHYYSSLLQLSGNHQKALSRLVWINAEHLDQVDKALEYAKTLVDAYNEDANSYHLLSWVHSKLGNIEEAAKALRVAKSLE